MIDVTTAGDDGHWDHADIKRLIEYRDRLKAALGKLYHQAFRESFTNGKSALMVEAMYEAAQIIHPFSEETQSLGPPDTICPKCGHYVMNTAETETERGNMPPWPTMGTAQTTFVDAGRLQPRNLGSPDTICPECGAYIMNPADSAEKIEGK